MIKKPGETRPKTTRIQELEERIETQRMELRRMAKEHNSLRCKIKFANEDLEKFKGSSEKHAAAYREMYNEAIEWRELFLASEKAGKSMAQEIERLSELLAGMGVGR